VKTGNLGNCLNGYWSTILNKFILRKLFYQYAGNKLIIPKNVLHTIKHLSQSIDQILSKYDNSEQSYCAGTANQSDCRNQSNYGWK